MKNAMHYIVGNSVDNGAATISQIIYEPATEFTSIWVKNKDRNEVIFWKGFSRNMPIVFEGDLNFGFNV